VKNYTQRTYRNNIAEGEFISSFRVVVKETDLLVRADRQLTVETEASVIRYRRLIEGYIDRFPSFLHTLTPFPEDQFAPSIVRDMIKAGEVTGVGPMASVAGAIAEWVGRDLLKYSQRVIVENGGDIFIKTDKAVTVGIFAGSSPLSNKVGIKIDPDGEPIAVCTSSGTVGHSLSLGKTDAVTVVSRSASLADAAATAVGNMISAKTDIDKGINFTGSVTGIIGVVIVIGDMIGLKGNVKLVRIG
jgi:ApbE superfamily uncharacterized protein (UPF0280 family)